MKKEVKPGDTVFEDEESKKLREEMEERLKKQTKLIEQMMDGFTKRYVPGNDPSKCDLKSTWEIVEMFESIFPIDSSTISLCLMDLGFKTSLIGNEFKWMLRPTSSF